MPNIEAFERGHEKREENDYGRGTNAKGNSTRIERHTREGSNQKGERKYSKPPRTIDFGA